MKKDFIRVIVNSVLAIAVFTVWILSFFFWRDSTLGGSGWSDLKYFTVQSNLLVGVVAVLWLVFRLAKGKGGVPRWLTLLKYLSTVAVSVTFLVVLTFLGPLYGYGRMYYGANLFFHLLVPLFAMGEYALLEEGEISFRMSFFAALPPFLYGIGYLTNCLVNGIGSWDTVRHDWYSFLEWGYPVGIAMFLLLCAVAWGLGLALRAMNRAAKRIPWEGRK